MYYTQILPLTVFRQTATCLTSETYAYVVLAIASAEAVIDTFLLIPSRHPVCYAKYVITLFIHLLFHINYHFITYRTVSYVYKA